MALVDLRPESRTFGAKNMYLGDPRQTQREIGLLEIKKKRLDVANAILAHSARDETLLSTRRQAGTVRIRFSYRTGRTCQPGLRAGFDGRVAIEHSHPTEFTIVGSLAFSRPHAGAHPLAVRKRGRTLQGSLRFVVNLRRFNQSSTSAGQYRRASYEEGVVATCFSCTRN